MREGGREMMKSGAFLSRFHAGMECTHQSLYHLHSLFPEFVDDGDNVHSVLLLSLLQGMVDGDECASPSYTSTEEREGMKGGREGMEGGREEGNGVREGGREGGNGGREGGREGGRKVGRIL